MKTLQLKLFRVGADNATRVLERRRDGCATLQSPAAQCCNTKREYVCLSEHEQERDCKRRCIVSHPLTLLRRMHAAGAPIELLEFSVTVATAVASLIARFRLRLDARSLDLVARVPRADDASDLRKRSRAAPPRSLRPRCNETRSRASATAIGNTTIERTPHARGTAQSPRRHTKLGRRNRSAIAGPSFSPSRLLLSSSSHSLALGTSHSRAHGLEERRRQRLEQRKRALAACVRRR